MTFSKPVPHDGATPPLPGTAPEPVPFNTHIWWLATAESDAAAFAPKFDEYGSDDLARIGYKMADLMGREVDVEEANEIGIYFYLEGKLARWHEAIQQGRRVSDDTLLDGTTYFNMARLNRAGGMV